MDCLILTIIFLMPIFLLITVFFKALKNKPGFRRRPGSEAGYSGTERRCPFRTICRFNGQCPNDTKDCVIKLSLLQQPNRDEPKLITNDKIEPPIKGGSGEQRDSSV